MKGSSVQDGILPLPGRAPLAGVPVTGEEERTSVFSDARGEAVVSTFTAPCTDGRSRCRILVGGDGRGAELVLPSSRPASLPLRPSRSLTLRLPLASMGGRPA